MLIRHAVIRPRGSGGVGLLAHEEVIVRYIVEVLEAKCEGCAVG